MSVRKRAKNAKKGLGGSHFGVRTSGLTSTHSHSLAPDPAALQTGTHRRLPPPDIVSDIALCEVGSFSDVGAQTPYNSHSHSH